MLKFAMMMGVAAVAAVPALAQPTVQPTRDVVVTYHVSGRMKAPPGQPAVDTIRIGYTAQAKRTFIEPVGQPIRMITDKAAGHMIMIMEQQHMYMEMPYDQSRVMNFSADGAKFQRLGTKTIAGVSCTEYDVQGPQHTGTACLTDDGVMLRAESRGGEHDGTLEATAVAYGAIPDSAFAPPPGFQKMDMAHMQRPAR